MNSKLNFKDSILLNIHLLVLTISTLVFVFFVGISKLLLSSLISADIDTIKNSKVGKRLKFMESITRDSKEDNVKD